MKGGYRTVTARDPLAVDVDKMVDRLETDSPAAGMASLGRLLEALGVPTDGTSSAISGGRTPSILEDLGVQDGAARSIGIGARGLQASCQPSRRCEMVTM